MHKNSIRNNNVLLFIKPDEAIADESYCHKIRNDKLKLKIKLYY